MKERVKKIRFWFAHHLFGDILLDDFMEGLGLGQNHAYANVYRYMKYLYGKDAEEWCADAWSYVEKKVKKDCKVERADILVRIIDNNKEQQ